MPWYTLEHLRRDAARQAEHRKLLDNDVEVTRQRAKAMTLPYDVARCFGFDPDVEIGCPTRGRCKRWTNRKDFGNGATLVYDFMCETSRYEHRIPVEGTE